MGDDILLDGWALPFKTDTEGNGVFSGNACFNLVGEPETIRECIEGLAVLPVTESAKAKIIVTRAERVRAEIVDGRRWTEVDDPNDLAVARFAFEPERRSEILETRVYHVTAIGVRYLDRP